MNKKRKTLLMIALDFPPCQSAGAQRAQKFATHLSEFGWDVVVLTAKASVYERCDPHAETPGALHIERCAAFDAARDLSWRGKYAGFLTVPDKYWSWALSAIPAGKRLIKRFRPSAIFSTYPVSTAHFIGYRLQQWSGLPWLADYRDPLQCRYDPGARHYSALGRWIEKRTIETCHRAIFTTQNAARLYSRLYPDEPLAKFLVIENGFDEDKFKSLSLDSFPPDKRFILLHSGALYGDGRDPTVLFQAIWRLHQQGRISDLTFCLRFRGVSPSTELAKLLRELNIHELVEFLPPVPYGESLQEMMSANALLLLQGPLFNNQIPSKLYDYIRTGRRIVAMTPRQGATAQALFEYANGKSGDTVDQVERMLIDLLEGRQSNASFNLEHLLKFSRYARTRELANALETI